MDFIPRIVYTSLERTQHIARKNYESISEAVKKLCVQLALMNGSEAEFKDGLRKLVHTDAFCHAIGTALQKWVPELRRDDIERVWKLANEVDVRIERGGKSIGGSFRQWL